MRSLRKPFPISSQRFLWCCEQSQHYLMQDNHPKMARAKASLLWLPSEKIKRETQRKTALHALASLRISLLNIIVTFHPHTLSAIIIELKPIMSSNRQTFSRSTASQLPQSLTSEDFPHWSTTMTIGINLDTGFRSDLPWTSWVGCSWPSIF